MVGRFAGRCSTIPGKKGWKCGIDGIKFFHDIEGEARKIVISVKGGNLKADDVRP